MSAREGMAMDGRSLATQELPIASVRNIRQLGGYVGADGRRVRDDLLIRSGSLAILSEEDARTLEHRYHLRDVVDFRTVTEQGRKPDIVPEGATYHSFPAMDDETYRQITKVALGAVIGGSGDAYLDSILAMARAGRGGDLTRDFLGDGLPQRAYRGLFDVLLGNDGEGAVLWHCSQGKDRAGVASALTLAALGASLDTIVFDYSLSAEVYADIVRRAEAYARERDLDPEVTARLLGYAACGFPDLLRSTLEDLIREHGSLEAYLSDQFDLTEADFARLRDAYLEPKHPRAGRDRGTVSAVTSRSLM